MPQERCKGGILPARSQMLPHRTRRRVSIVATRTSFNVCVQRAKELDMGILGISPIDKGGRLYQPSSTVARTLGPTMSPIAFACLYAWQQAGIDTLTVGFARPADLDELMEAVELLRNEKESKKAWLSAHGRFQELAERKLGKEWKERSLLHLPTCFEPCTMGVSIGHTLWCYNCK